MDVVEVLDRVFKKGIVIETSGASDANAGALRVSVADVDVLRTKADGFSRVPPKTRKRRK